MPIRPAIRFVSLSHPSPVPEKLIDRDTRLSQVLDSVPGALEYVIGLNPHDFNRLRNPVLRRYMANRISLGRVAAMTAVPEDEVVGQLRALAGQPDTPTLAAGVLPESSEEAPSWMADVDYDAIRVVDLFQVDAVEGDPFPAISLAVRQLGPGEVLVIRHHWDPQPLYDIWSKMGMQWWAQQVGPDEWHVFVRRPAEAAGFEVKPVVGSSVGSLPPPEVVPRIVSLAEQLRPGQVLQVTGVRAASGDAIRLEVLEALGAGYTWSASPPMAETITATVTRVPNST